MATVAENLQTILDIKNDIKDAIIAKGVSVADSDGFGTYASKIESIETGGGSGSTADGFDFSVLGYDTTLNNSCNDKIQADIDYSKTIFDNWNPNTTIAISEFYNDKKLVYCPNIDTINVTNMGSMFSHCESLTTIPLLNTSNVNDMSSMFTYCSNLQTIPLLNTSNVTNMSSMFNGCKSLTTIPLLNTSNVTNMSSMFYNCSTLQSIPLLDTSNVTDMRYLFYGCDIINFPKLDTTNNETFYRIIYSGNSNIKSIPLLECGNLTNISNFNGTSDKTQLTDLGGFKNLKIDWNDNNGLVRFPNLTYESIMNVINNLYDFIANGESTTRTLKINSNTYALLSSEDIAVATAKGWTISK